MNKPEKILITGAAGFIGSKIAQKASENYELVLVDDLSYGSKANLIFDDFDLSNQLTIMDISDFDKLEELFEIHKFDYIISLAGIAPLPDCQSDPIKAYKVNTLANVKLLELCRKKGIKRFVLASTNAVYENSKLPHLETRILKPHLIYPNTKLAAENIAFSYSSCYKIPTTVLRFSNVYGPNNDFRRKNPPLIPYIIKSLYLDQSPLLHHDGSQSRDYIYIDDLVNLVFKTLSSVQTHDVVNVSSNKSYTVKEIYKFISDIMNKKYPPIYKQSKDFWLKHDSINDGYFELKSSVVVNEVLKETLTENIHALRNYDWEPSYDMYSGLKETVQKQMNDMDNYCD